MIQLIFINFMMIHVVVNLVIISYCLYHLPFEHNSDEFTIRKIAIGIVSSRSTLAFGISFEIVNIVILYKAPNKNDLYETFGVNVARALIHLVDLFLGVGTIMPHLYKLYSSCFGLVIQAIPLLAGCLNRVRPVKPSLNRQKTLFSPMSRSILSMDFAAMMLLSLYSVNFFGIFRLAFNLFFKSMFHIFLLFVDSFLFVFSFFAFSLF